MKIALDTNRYSDLCRGVQEVADHLTQAERIFMPFVVLGELRAGFQAGTRARQNEQQLVRFLNSPRVRLLLPDEQTTHHYATLFAQLRRQGTPIPTNDIWIAALVMQHDLVLLARDQHFDHLPQVPRL
ncbi:MAG: type II toxin-antitoxin system VapC family toxin [Verrucomicrobia bacterium]|nr:type II toxin-antitoxin system VapC family toxin [Verrucomicrobiota bacterium]